MRHLVLAFAAGDVITGADFQKGGTDQDTGAPQDLQLFVYQGSGGGGPLVASVTVPGPISNPADGWVRADLTTPYAVPTSGLYTIAFTCTGGVITYGYDNGTNLYQNYYGDNVFTSLESQGLRVYGTPA